ncbi:hypothetical protein WP3W18E02_19460 [Klebsiella sp. WP3-W18-ESBL-02]|nr:hypothetical protein WP3W18E02_19460 [Klebsiella sp. WP3-W18-ESBL-02]
MTTNLTDLSNQLALEILDDETLDELIQFRRGTTEYHISQGNKVQAIMHNAVLSALIELQERRKAAEPVGEDELDHLIWGLERHGNLKHTLAALKELREWRKTAGAPQNRRSCAKVQVLPPGMQTAPALDSSPKNAESPSGMNAALVNDVTSGKRLTITLPDVSSKAFWSGTTGHEVFHPETYKRWVKEAIERDCIIAGVGVKVK